MSPDGRPRDQYGNIILSEGAGDGQPRDQYGNIIYGGDSGTMPRDQYGNPIREGAGDGLLPRDQYGNIITTDVNGEPLQDGQIRDAAGNIIVTKNVYITTTTTRNPNDDSAQVQHVTTHKRRASLHLIAAFFTNTSVFCCFFCHFTLKSDVSAHGASQWWLSFSMCKYAFCQHIFFVVLFQLLIMCLLQMLAISHDI